MTPGEIAQVAQNAGFQGDALVTAVAVALAESGGDPNSQGDVGLGAPGPTSFGLWQVHIPAHPEYNAADMLDPQKNAYAAFAISSGGTNWAPWSTYNSGAYLSHMAEAQAGASSPSATPAASVPQSATTLASTTSADLTGGFGTGLSLWDVLSSPGGLGEMSTRIGESVAGALLVGFGLVLVGLSLLGRAPRGVTQTGSKVVGWGQRLASLVKFL